MDERAKRRQAVKMRKQSRELRKGKLRDGERVIMTERKNKRR